MAKIREADGFDYGYISSIAWDGEFLYGVGLWGDLLRIDRILASPFSLNRPGIRSVRALPEVR